MKSILEKALVHLLNEETEKAQELMHQFVIERARSIHESLRENDDDDLDAVDASLEEQFFTEDDLSDEDAADQLSDDLDADDQDDGAVDPSLDGGADAPVDGADADADAPVGDDQGDDTDLTSKIDDIEDEIKSLQAEFDKIMAEFDDGDQDDDVAVADNDTIADDVDTGAEDGSETDDDEFDDITESLVSDLKKIAVPNEDGRGATGEKLSTKTVSPVAKDAKPRVPSSKNTVEHTGYDREKAPSTKDGADRGRKYDNNRVKATSGNAPVPATGPKGAELAKPVAGNTKSVISGARTKK